MQTRRKSYFTRTKLLKSFCLKAISDILTSSFLKFESSGNKTNAPRLCLENHKHKALLKIIFLVHWSIEAQSKIENKNALLWQFELHSCFNAYASSLSEHIVHLPNSLCKTRVMYWVLLNCKMHCHTPLRVSSLCRIPMS